MIQITTYQVLTAVSIFLYSIFIYILILFYFLFIIFFVFYFFIYLFYFHFILFFIYLFIFWHEMLSFSLAIGNLKVASLPSFDIFRQLLELQHNFALHVSRGICWECLDCIA